MCVGVIMMRTDIFNRFSNPFQMRDQQKEQQHAQKQALIRKNYAEIYAHEKAHQNAGGALAGPIVIEKNEEGIPVGGHVNIKMPSLNPANPQKAIDDASTVIRAAMAPSDPSSQDYAVANQAQNIKMQAQAMKKEGQGSKLDIQA